MTKSSKRSRRDFLKRVSATSALAAVGTTAIGRNRFAVHRLAEPARVVSPNDNIRIALVGAGIIGFIDTDTALKVPGVELVAAADVFEPRKVRVKEYYGSHVDTYTDYREILARDDVDAVLLCVPDHWHAPMSIDAMRAGKAVYCEKPMTRTVAEGMDVVNVANETGVVFQVGSQQGSSILNQKARELIAAGAIGELNMVESKSARNTSIGAWQYSVAQDATPENLDWDRFLGSAPKRPFEPIRCFRWRNYWDYGTAVAGDIFVHHFTGIHKAVNSIGPETIMATGGLRYWKDGRDVYDVIAGICNYPETDTHPGFTLTLSTNWVSGGGGGGYFRYIGSEGELAREGNGLTLRQVGVVDKHEHSPDTVIGGYNSVRTWSEASQKVFIDWFMAQRKGPEVAPPMKGETRYEAPDGYDSRFDHLANFFDSIRNGTPVFEDATYGHRAAAPANLCNDSYRQGKVMKWDAEKMEMVA